jgi:hypothetical protein
MIIISTRPVPAKSRVRCPPGARRAQPLDRPAVNGRIKSVIRHVDAWMLAEDLGSSARWNEVIAFRRIPIRNEDQRSLSPLLGPASQTTAPGAMAPSVGPSTRPN